MRGAHAGVWTSALQTQKGRVGPALFIVTRHPMDLSPRDPGDAGPSGQVRGRGWHRLSRAGVGCTPGAVVQLTPQCGWQGARASFRPCSVTLQNRVVGQPMVGAQVVFKGHSTASSRNPASGTVFLMGHLSARLPLRFRLVLSS